MKTYLELEGKLGPKPRPYPQTKLQPHTSAPPQNKNPLTRKAQDPKHLKRRGEPENLQKKKVQAEGNCQPLPTTPTTSVPVNPTPTPKAATSNASTQISIVKSTATSILVMVYNLAKENWMEFPTQQKDPRLRKIYLKPGWIGQFPLYQHPL